MSPPLCSRMIVWLASYPRSGNTLLRIILKEVFRRETYSIYDDKYDIGASAGMSAAVGHKNHGLTRDEFRAMASSSPDVYYVKTHEQPSDDSKAIYVVRDGRAAIVSHFHYLRDFGGLPVSLEDVVCGYGFGGLWSDHVWGWILPGRPNVLVVRFEDLAKGDAATLEKIGTFLDLERQAEFDVKFEDLKAVNDKFFRNGDNTEGISLIAAQCPQLFNLFHGEVMQKLVYGEAGELLKSDLAAEIRNFAKQLRAGLKPAAPRPKASP